MTDTFFAIPWRQMLLPELSWAEKLVRPLLVVLPANTEVDHG